MDHVKYFDNYSGNKAERRKNRAITAVFIAMGLVIGIYVLFYMDFSMFGFPNDYPELVEIPDEKIIAECPEIAISDEDRAWLDGIVSASEKYCAENSPEAEVVYGISEFYKFRADERGLEHYPAKQDDNYLVYEYHDIADASCVDSIVLIFEKRTSGFLVYEEELSKWYTDLENERTAHYSREIKVSTVTGRSIRKYYVRDDKYSKIKYTYGLVNVFRGILDAMMSV